MGEPVTATALSSYQDTYAQLFLVATVNPGPTGGAGVRIFFEQATLIWGVNQGCDTWTPVPRRRGPG
jgi:hypothetical protein